MVARYAVIAIDGQGAVVDLQRGAIRDPAAIIWRGPYAVAVELSGLAEELSKHGADDRVRWVLDRARQRAENFVADSAGRELGRALVQARPWTVLTL